MFNICVRSHRIRTTLETYLFPMSQSWILRKARNCLRTEDEVQTALSVNDLLGSFTVWAIGIACALVALLGEFVIPKISFSRKSKCFTRK